MYGADGMSCSRRILFWLIIRLRWCFNLTLLITGVFSITAGASPNKVALCGMVAAWSVGVGGNLPVDSAVFLGTPFQAYFTMFGASNILKPTRVYTCNPPVLAHRTLHLVGCRAARRQSGRLAASHRLLMRLRSRLPAELQHGLAVLPLQHGWTDDGLLVPPLPLSSPRKPEVPNRPRPRRRGCKSHASDR